MSRKLKNIIMIVLVVILIATSCFTVYLSINDSDSSLNMMQGNESPNVALNDGEADFSEGEANGEEPPEMPDEENSSDMQESEKPDDESDGEEPPEKPDGESDGEEQTDGNLNSESETEEIPEGPSDDTSMQDNREFQFNDNGTNNIKTIYYVLFDVQSLFISLIVIYLLMSKFNKRKFKETFYSKDKVVIYILSNIIFVSILTLVCCGAAKNINFSNEDLAVSENTSYSAATEITEDTEITDESYSSSTADENAILVSGDINVTLSNITVSKTGDSDGGDNTSFYGTNSAILAKDGANLTITGATITTDATGANGVFSYGGSATTNNTSSDGTTVTISDSIITTTKDNSGGIMTTGGGVMIASNLTVNTSGISSAAIRTDRGGGTVSVSGGTYTTAGQGSPAIYSTATITVSNATLISKVAEGIAIEGKNSVVLDNCDLTASNTKLNGLSTTYKNIFLYQSMSGDAAEGDSSFTATDSTITTNNGDTFYITNTSAIITLSNNTITNNDSSGNFLRAQADSWGEEGSNGGDVTLLMTNQSVTGNIVIDDVSTLDMTLEENSSLEGVINADNTAKSITLTLDETSYLTLTGDCYVTELNNADTTNSNINFNGYTLYVNGQAIN